MGLLSYNLLSTSERMDLMADHFEDSLAVLPLKLGVGRNFFEDLPGIYFYCVLNA